MRALLIWCALGAGLIGLKAHLDHTAAKYPEVAVRAGGDTYFIPRAFVRTNGWRADVQRLAGCWDAREAGLVPVAAPVAACGSVPLELEVPASAFGADGETALRGKPLRAIFWPSYAPPAEHLVQLVDAWSGKGQWLGRSIAVRRDWQLATIASANTPWIHLLTGEPKSGSPGELASLYAGRCYRPEPLSDVGMTCDVAIRLKGAAIEYSLGPDEAASFALLRSAIRQYTDRLRR